MKTVLAAAAASILTASLCLAQLEHHHAGFSLQARMQHKKRMELVRRKTIGWGDSTKAPSTVAKGSDSADCTCWHTVRDGEVCLGLIDKSSQGFTIEKFFKLNPSLNNDCSNLVAGVAYCVDDGVNTYPNGTVAGSNNKAEKNGVDLAAAASSSAASPSASTSTATTTNNDDDEEEEDDGDEDEEPDCPSSSARPATTAAQVNTVKAAIAPVAGNTPTWSAPSPLNTWVAPAETSTSSTVVPPPATSSSTTSNGGSGGQSFNGEATFYYQGGQPGGNPVAGACGTVSQDTDYVAAIYTHIYSSGANCGRKVRVTNTQSGASVTVTAMDLCPSCSDDGHIDLSVAAYDALGLQSAGVLPVTWQFIS